MASVPSDFPDSYSHVLARLSAVLGDVRRVAEQACAAPDSPIEDAAESLRALQADLAEVLEECARALNLAGQPALALTVHGCRLAWVRLHAVPSLQGQESLRAVQRALEAVEERAQGPVADAVMLSVELFPLYRAVQHLAGAERVHPADLWPGPAIWVDLPADPFTAPRGVDAQTRETFEAALLALMRQPGQGDLQHMAEVCAALGEGTSSPAADLWKLASAVYEAQAQGLLEPDVYLKRLGAKLLALTKPAQGSGGPAAAVVVGPSEDLAFKPLQSTAYPPHWPPSLRLLGHELLFQCHRALVTQAAALAPGAQRLQRVAQAYGLVAKQALAKTPEPPSSRDSPQSLVEAVPGLPAAADLDLSSWDRAANADQALAPVDEIRVIGPLRLEIPVFNTFLNDADEASRRLSVLLAEWGLEPSDPLPQETVQQSQALAEGADHVGHVSLAALAGTLTTALRQYRPDTGMSSPAAQPRRSAACFIDAAEEIRRVLHQFAAGFLIEPSQDCFTRLTRELSGSPDQALGTGELPQTRHLAELRAAQLALANSLERLGGCRPSDLLSTMAADQADRVFSESWHEARDLLRACEHALDNVLQRPGAA